MFTAPVRGTANRAYTRNLQPQAHTHWPDECQCLSGRGRPSGRLRPLSYGGGSRTDIREAVTVICLSGHDPHLRRTNAVWVADHLRRRSLL